MGGAIAIPYGGFGYHEWTPMNTNEEGKEGANHGSRGGRQHQDPVNRVVLGRPRSCWVGIMATKRHEKGTGRAGGLRSGGGLLFICG